MPVIAFILVIIAVILRLVGTRSDLATWLALIAVGLLAAWDTWLWIGPRVRREAS